MSLRDCLRFATTSTLRAADPHASPSASGLGMSTPGEAAKHWRRDTDTNGICTLTLDRVGSSTNVLSGEVLLGLEQHLDALADAPPRALLFASAKRGFIAGADISEFTTIETTEQAYALIRRGQLIIDRISDLPYATVAVINGFALGGGLELALACRYRVLTDDPSAVLGLPEVKLGIHPGFGGTVRSIRLLGPLPALGMMLTGRNVRSREAKRIGLVDAVVPARHLLRAAKSLVESPPAPVRRPAVQTLLDSPGIRS
ncbi:MAG: enoyl-CoA hydratase-related protein, partial [Pseudomonadota bacterium]